MTLTNFLCKHFDEENKGYVTVEDIVDVCFYSFIPNIILVLLCSIVLILMSGFIGSLYNNTIPNENVNINTFTSDCLTGLVIISIFCSVCFILYKLYTKISQFKVVMCPLSEEE